MSEMLKSITVILAAAMWLLSTARQEQSDRNVRVNSNLTSCNNLSASLPDQQLSWVASGVIKDWFISNISTISH